MPILLSFGVYLVPLVGPHTFWFLGQGLAISFASDRPPAWFATELGVALAAQVVVWAIVRWSLRGGLVRTLAWLGLLPVAAALNVAFLSTIPANFLIEPDRAPEVATWPEHCVAPGVSLSSVRVGVRASPEAPGAWWGQRSDGSYALIQAADCRVIEAKLPMPTVQPGGHVDFTIGLASARRDGAALVQRTTTGPTSEQQWLVLPTPGEALVPLDTPDGAQGAPVLASGGEAVAWLERIAGTGPPLLSRVRVRPWRLGAAEEVVIPLEPFGASSYAIADVDVAARDVLLWSRNEPLLIGFDGQRKPLPFDLADVPSYETHTRGVAGGWVAWDGYREDGPYRVTWSIGANRGTHMATLGRGITAVAVDPTGTYIAVSETTALSIGDARDVVYVIRTDTKADVFRRFLPRYARSEVVFLGGGLFAYSDLEGTHVLRVPSPSPRE